MPGQQKEITEEHHLLQQPEHLSTEDQEEGFLDDADVPTLATEEHHLLQQPGQHLLDIADLLEGDQQGGRTRQQRRRVRGLSQKVSRNPIIEIQELPNFLSVFHCINLCISLCPGFCVT